jgi:hypothetical protein
LETIAISLSQTFLRPLQVAPREVKLAANIAKVAPKFKKFRADFPHSARVFPQENFCAAGRKSDARIRSGFPPDCWPAAVPQLAQNPLLRYT